MEYCPTRKILWQVRLSCYFPLRAFVREYSINAFPKRPTNEVVSYKSFMKNIISYEEYKKDHVENLETFKKSPTIQLVAKGDSKKIERAYERFCRSQYAEYKQQQMGGNPSEMI